ncbi:MAG TPA: metallophosphoesterase family protein [Verrucomicrobiota bacterium]|nr:metallophosphoesterase family protein [Verrucomicrobiota bacterium]HNU51909.1 metallophosphoesterase family protein [Verrucomicrobiota bacterium]
MSLRTRPGLRCALLGILADTHNVLDPRIAGIFAGVDRIVHAGDIGLPWVLRELEAMAPLIAVTGNTDFGLACRETEVFEVGRHRFLVHHIVDPHRPSPVVVQLLERHRPDVVVFGHTHRPFCERVDGVLYVNPGSAGRPRMEASCQVAVMEVGVSDLDVRQCLLD